ncbi:MAG: peptidoglycan DD-metalloendopeptidase family protein [Anaerolineales bacterium]
MKRGLFACAATLLLTVCAAPATPTVTANPLPSATATLQPSPTATLTPSATPIPITAVCSPLADHALSDLGRYVSQPFIAPVGSNKETGHHGVDFAYYRRDGVGDPLEGNPIQSALDGTMAGLGYNAVYGNYLIIETPFERLPADLAALYPMQAGESLYLLYAHMQDLAPFEIREPLDCGQQIGQVGESGRQPDLIAEPHLHFETRVGRSGIFIEPMAFYDTRASEAEKEEYTKWRSSGIFKLFDPMMLIEYGAGFEVING